MSIESITAASPASIAHLSGPRSRYPGKLGMIEWDAYADLLLINGDPIEDISILTKPEENLALIMKDGRSTRKPPSCKARRAP